MIPAVGKTVVGQACVAVSPFLNTLVANLSPQLLTTRLYLQSHTDSLLAVAQGKSGFGSSLWSFKLPFEAMANAACVDYHRHQQPSIDDSLHTHTE